jgi:hypothetical protein
VDVLRRVMAPKCLIFERTAQQSEHQKTAMVRSA